jgi:hypothetical protein
MAIGFSIRPLVQTSAMTTAAILPTAGTERKSRRVTLVRIAGMARRPFLTKRGCMSKQLQVSACLLWSVLLSNPLSNPASAPTLESLRREFADPPKEVRPSVRWWWPGGDVESDELVREVRILDAAGFGGAEIQAFRNGLKPDMSPEIAARVNDYPTASFYQKVRAAVDEAGRRGLFIDLTMGSGWPFGGGQAITPELASIQLLLIHKDISGPAHVRERVELPAPRATAGMTLARSAGSATDELPAGWNERLQARTKIIAVLAMKGTEPVLESRQGAVTPEPLVVVKKSGWLDPQSTKVLTRFIRPDGTLDWTAPAGEWHLLILFQQPVDTRVIGGVGQGPQLVLDHMNRRALEAHLDRTMAAAAPELSSQYGKTVRAGFCDSLEVESEIFWTDDFLREFRNRRGYDLTPWLPFIDVPGRGNVYPSYLSAPLFDGPGAERVRKDYWQTVSDLWMENFFTPLSDELHARGLKARIQAHGAPVDLLRAYATADIPETEQLASGGKMEFLKLASSAAHVYGRPLVSAESFVHPGMAYKSTEESLERDANRLIAAGVNEIVYHGFPYVYLDRPEPGWYPFARGPMFSDHFSEHNTALWPAIPSVNAYITHLQLVSRRARPVHRYALYIPDLAYLKWINNGPARATIDYDYVNDGVLNKSSVRNGKLVVPSGAEYEVLVLLADNESIRKKFAGVQIEIGELPADESPARWQLENAEFRFYVNDTNAVKEYSLEPGSYELWDAATGQITSYTPRRVRLEPGKALLLLKK